METLADNGPQGPEIGAGLLGRAQVRFADDLHQRGTGAVEVHEADGPVVGMDQLAGVLLHVDAGQADAPVLALHIDVHVAVDGDGQLVLGYLIPFWQIGIKIILAGKAALSRNGAIRGQCHA